MSTSISAQGTEPSTFWSLP